MIPANFWDAVNQLSAFITITSKIEEIIRGESKQQIIRKINSLCTDVDFAILPQDKAHYADLATGYIHEKKKRNHRGFIIFTKRKRCVYCRLFFKEFEHVAI